MSASTATPTNTKINIEYTCMQVLVNSSQYFQFFPPCCCCWLLVLGEGGGAGILALSLSLAVLVVVWWLLVLLLFAPPKEGKLTNPLLPLRRCVGESATRSSGQISSPSMASTALGEAGGVPLMGDTDLPLPVGDLDPSRSGPADIEIRRSDPVFTRVPHSALHAYSSLARAPSTFNLT